MRHQRHNTTAMAGAAGGGTNVAHGHRQAALGVPTPRAPDARAATRLARALIAGMDVQTECEEIE
jgi:hypothetical protein